MEFKVEKVENGFIITQYETDDDDSLASSLKITKTIVKEDSEIDTAASLLREILDLVGDGGNKFTERIYVVKAPGHKNEAFSDAHAEVIYGKDE